MSAYATYNRGMILVLTLMFLLIISMLSFTTIEMSQLRIKAQQQFKQRQSLFQIAEGGLNQIEKEIMNNIPKHCLEQNKDEIIATTLPCIKTIDETSLRYGINFLGEYACVAINGHTGVRYFRVTVAAFVEQRNFPPVILQSIYVIPTTDLKVCSGTINELSTARQSWREII